MIRNVLFDLDGTIIDSSPCIFYVYTELFKELGLKLPSVEKIRRFIGPPVETTISSYLSEGVDEACRRFREIYQTVDLMKTNVLYDGMANELEKLKKSGRRIFLTTSKAEPSAIKILQGFGIYPLFDGVYGARPELKRYQKSHVIDALCEERGLNKNDCILIGDTVFDVDGAEQCGIKVAIVNYGFGNKEDFKERKIEFFADEVAEIADKIERL